MNAKPTNTSPDLIARGLVAGYMPGIEILKGISVHVVRRQIRCVLGPNGTGKSTLLKVLFGFLRPQQGDIQLGTTSLKDVSPHEMGRYGIAYLPQRPSVFPFLSVDVNLRLGTWQFRKDRGLVRARTERAFQQFPVLRERRHQMAGTLSGGQQRQLEIARSLMTDPAVFLIDEPTASIEPRVSAQIYALIAQLAHDGHAILLVDQNIKGALGIADYVYVIRSGMVFEEGLREQFSEDAETLVSRWLYTQ